MKRKIIIVLLCVMISACATHSGVAESSPNHFKWYVDEFWQGGPMQADVSILADRHCQKYNKRAILAQTSAEFPLFTYWEYDCIPREQYICLRQLHDKDLQKCAASDLGKNKFNSQQIDTNRIFFAEDKCLDLGFSRNTSKFGDCVLQLSK